MKYFFFAFVTASILANGKGYSPAWNNNIICKGEKQFKNIDREMDLKTLFLLLFFFKKKLHSIKICSIDTYALPHISAARWSRGMILA